MLKSANLKINKFMDKNIEIEIRGPLVKEKFDNLAKLLETKGVAISLQTLLHLECEFGFHCFCWEKII